MGVDLACTALLLLLLFPRELCALSVLQVLELLEVAARRVLWILQGDDVGASKGLIIHQVLPHFCLDVHALDRVPRKDIGVCAVANRHNVRVVREYFVRDGIDQVALAVATARAEDI